ncbi:MAG: 23S rRNA (uracil(1939)-C(5))-methyltransferase RlmD [Oscillospiraceae bacterium]
MLIQNQIYTATITDYTIQGQGIAHVEGCAVFIPNAIAGEVCEIQITKAAKTWAAGRIRRILEVSPHRVNRACPQSKLCGGCAFQHMDYQEECRLKAERVRQALNRLGGEALKTMDLLPAPETRRYRNKAQYPVAQEKQRAMAGFYREGTHQVVSCPQCGILAPEMDAVRDAVVDYMNQYRVSAYDEGSGTGLVRHIYVRKGWVSGQLLVCLVVNGTRLPRQEALLERLQRIPGFATLVLSVHQKPGNAVLGNTFHTLYGPGWIEDTLCGLTFRLSPRSFYQVNHDQAERLYALAIAGAGIQKTDVVLDLYCGVGTITLAMAKAAGRVIGVEVEPQAVADAQDNARRNGVQNAEFFCGDAGQAALSLREQGLTPDVVVVDPPRKGLSPDVIQALTQMSPRKIVYISCDPATLARDVALLKEQNFRLLEARAVDMFPRCAHVETVAWLSMGEIGESTRGKQRNFDC